MTPETRKGLLEAVKALAAAIVVACAVAGLVTLAGCSGFRITADYTHHSSIPTMRDRNTTDMVGLCGETRLGRDCGPYCPEMEACASWEVNGRPTYGPDPAGTIRFKQPLWVRK